MSTEDNALPNDVTNDAGASEPADNAAAAQHIEQNEEADANTAEKHEDKSKPEKTEAEREIARLRRRVDNLTRQKYELRANMREPAQEHQRTTEEDDSEHVTFTKAELQRYVAEQAKQLAPAMNQQQAEIERRQGVVASLAKDWGQEKFDNLAAELDEAFGGLADRSGNPKAATEAIFNADDPKAVIEYLADPDNAEEAERISKLPPIQAGRAIAKLEVKLEEARSKAKPKPSNAARPIEPARGGGVPNGMPDPSNTKAYIAWANAQERAAR